MELPQEQYDYQAQLAEIGQKIAKANALLAGLDKTTKNKLIDQERQFSLNLSQLVVKYKEFLDNLSKKQDNWLEFNKNLDDYLNNFTLFEDEFTKLILEINDLFIKNQKELDNKISEIGEKNKDLQFQQQILEKQREVLKKRFGDLEKAKLHFESQRQSLKILLEKNG